MNIFATHVLGSPRLSGNCDPLIKLCLCLTLPFPQSHQMTDQTIMVSHQQSSTFTLLTPATAQTWDLRLKLGQEINLI